MRVAPGDPVHFGGSMAALGACEHQLRRGKVIGITAPRKKSPLDPSWATPRDSTSPDSAPPSGWACSRRRGAPAAFISFASTPGAAEALGYVCRRFIESAGGEAVDMSSKNPAAPR